MAQRARSVSVVISVSTGLQCPRCKHPEEHPDGKHVIIRGYKVESDGYWWSHCLYCAGGYYYDDNLDLVFDNDKVDGNKGWFHD